VSGKKITIAWNGMELRLDDKFPLMPGQVLAESPADKAKKAEPKPKKKLKTEQDKAEDEAAWRATLLKADLLNFEIAERQLAIVAPRTAKTRPKAKRA
jgi:hypothetical protein